MLQREMEALKSQVSQLQLKKKEDDLIIAKKTKEIRILKAQPIVDAQMAPFPLPGDLSLGMGIPRPVSKRPFLRSNSIAGSTPSIHYETMASGHQSSYGSKSIWASLNETSVDFGLFSDVRSQVCYSPKVSQKHQPSSDRALSTNGSDFGTPLTANTTQTSSSMPRYEEGKPLWNSWNANTRFVDVSNLVMKLTF